MVQAYANMLCIVVCQAFYSTLFSWTYIQPFELRGGLLESNPLGLVKGHWEVQETFSCVYCTFINENECVSRLFILS